MRSRTPCTPTSPATTRPDRHPEGSRDDDHREPRGRRRRSRGLRRRCAAAAGVRDRRRVAVGPRRGRLDHASSARRAGEAAHLLLPAAGLVGAAADHRAHHGAECVQRAVLPPLRRLLRRGEAPAAVGGRRAPVRVGRLAPADQARAPPGLSRLPADAGAPGARGPLRRADQRQQELAGHRPLHHAARRGGQARHRAVGGQHLRPQGAPPARAPPPPRAGGAGALRRHRPGARGSRPRHRDGPRGDPARHALGGGCPDAALRPEPVGARRRRCRARGDRRRAPPAHHPLHRSVQGLHRRRVAARARALRALQRRLAGAGDQRLDPEVG